jgi:hypothetical protein
MPNRHHNCGRGDDGEAETAQSAKTSRDDQRGGLAIHRDTRTDSQAAGEGTEAREKGEAVIRRDAKNSAWLGIALFMPTGPCGVNPPISYVGNDHLVRRPIRRHI